MCHGFIVQNSDTKRSLFRRVGGIGRIGTKRLVLGEYVCGPGIKFFIHEQCSTVAFMCRESLAIDQHQMIGADLEGKRQSLQREARGQLPDNLIG